MKLYLIDLINEGFERIFEIPDIGSAVIGRSKFAEIDLSEANAQARKPSLESRKYLGYISKDHCTIYMEGSYPYVVDNNSKNGTFVNGEKVNSTLGTLINNGDILSLGPYGFKVLFKEESKQGILKNKPIIPETSVYEPEKNLKPEN